MRKFYSFFVLLFIAANVLNIKAEESIVRTETYFVRGAITAFTKVYIDETAKNDVKEYGICWSTEQEPVIEDFKESTTEADLFITMEGLTPNTDYYARGYAIHLNNSVSYGNEINIKTIEKGEITYFINRDDNPDNTAIFDFLEQSVKEALEYYNNYTSVKTKHLNIQYNKGVATADANYAGSVRFGANTAYHRTGTVLHEMAHVMGGGQHASWWVYMVDGKWIGEKANENLRFMTGNSEDYVKGDNMHFWPYGINGAHEDKPDNVENLYLINVLIVQGMIEDGLMGEVKPVPDRVFEPIEGVKYYIKNGNVHRGRNTSFLKTTSDDLIVNAKMSNKDAVENDSVAWYVYKIEETEGVDDDVEGIVHYRIQNVATQKYFYYNGEYNSSTGNRGDNMITLKDEDNDALQRITFRLKDSKWKESSTTDPYSTLDTYGIIMDETNGDQALYLRTREISGTSSYNSELVSQWSFLTVDEIEDVPYDTAIRDFAEGSQVKVYTSSETIHIQSQLPQLCSVYSVDGKLIVQTEDDIISVQSGFYIVRVGQNVFKVLVQ